MRQWRKRWDSWDIGEMEAVMIIQIIQWGEKGENFRDTSTCLLGGSIGRSFFLYLCGPGVGWGLWLIDTLLVTR